MREWIYFHHIPVGYIEDGNFVSERGMMHYMRMFKGLGVSSGVLDILDERKIKLIIFMFEHDGMREALWITTEKLRSLNLMWQDTSKGFIDDQYFAPLSEMNSDEKKDDSVQSGLGEF